METDHGNLTCAVCVEQTAVSGVTLKKTLFKSASLVLGRNEFREIILKLESGKKALRFNLRETVVHKKFARDGKATIRLPKQNLQLLLSNCPPDKLIMFLKTMSTKLECLKMNGFVSERKKLLSELPRTFQDISPLNIKELQTVYNAKNKAGEDNTVKTVLGTLKRKNCMDGKENISNTLTKKARQQGGVQCTGSLSGSLRPMGPVILSKEQQRVLQAVVAGRNIFFTGSAGTGKSFLLRRIIGALPPQFTFATASTGVAACHIGGTTLHGFAGLGSGRSDIEQCVQLASRPLVRQQWLKCRHLIVDEISMVDGDFFDKLETVARVLRKNDQPFGGIQLILCGDFLQLPPVTKGTEKRKFAFQAKAWRSCIDDNFELTDVRRQSDKKFIDILQNIRIGRCPLEVAEALKKTSHHNIEKEGVLATRLCTHKEDVDLINGQQLIKLPGSSRSFESSDSDPGLVKMINTMCPVQKHMELKEGAQVMLAKNLDVQSGLVNGARGVVVGFQNDATGYPKVKFLCGETVTVRPDRWNFKVTGGIVLTRRQLPLKLAWAISIHKSQGMSLDCVEISLSRVFESGQAYVALSRARSLEGLCVMDFSSGCVRADPEVLRFYRNIKLISNDLLRQTKMTNIHRTPSEHL